MGKMTQVLAVYAALVSTAAVVWNIIIGRRDRGRIKIIRVMEYEKAGSARRLDKVGFAITNVGKRPIFLECWGVKREKKSPTLLHDLDKTLRESESIRVTVVKKGLSLPEGVENIYQIKRFFVKDSSVKNWRLTRKGRKILVRELAKALKSNVGNG